MLTPVKAIQESSISMRFEMDVGSRKTSDYSAEEIAEVFGFCFGLRLVLELAEFIQNSNQGN